VEYLLLIYGDEDGWEALSDEERETAIGEYVALRRDLAAQDKYGGSNELHGVETATTVRVRDGDALVTDGPFAETKEQVGGYFLVDAESLDEAIEWAARIPAARRGAVEIRPVVDRGGGGSSTS
jgi:hypothetical protein